MLPVQVIKAIACPDQVATSENIRLTVHRRMWEIGAFLHVRILTSSSLQL